MIFSAVRGLVSLAVDAAECLLVLGAGGYARVDELWEDTRTAAADRLADAEAEHEVTEPGRGGGNDAGEGAEPSSGAHVQLPPRDQVSPAAGVAPNPAAGDAPPSASFPTAGHPHPEYDMHPHDFRAIATGLRLWISGQSCDSPEWWTQCADYIDEIADTADKAVTEILGIYNFFGQEKK